MADKDREDAEAPSLEMPSLGGMLRRRRSKDPAARGPAGTPVAEAEAETVPEPERETSAPPLFADEVATDDEVAAPPPAAEVPADERFSPTTVDTAPVATATRTDNEDEARAEDRTEDEPDEEPGRRAQKPRRQLGLPAIPARGAAAFTGVVVGLLAVGLTWLGLQGCELVKGTQSCGGIGLLALLLILVAMVAVGSIMLRAWGVSDSLSTSFLAVGLIAVVCLLFLIEVLLSTWMLLVIPLVGAATYLLAHWVTHRFADASFD